MTSTLATAGLALFALLSALSAIAGFALVATRPNHVLFQWRGSPVHADALFGLAGYAGCFGSTVALFVAALGELL